MFSDIESRRSAAGIEQKVLCARAKVHETTYTARKAGRRQVSERTLHKLAEALDQLIEEKRKALDAIAEQGDALQ